MVQNYAKQLEKQLCYLPSYSPHLNLIERFWNFIRNECLYSKYYANFADFKAAISNWIVTANTDKQEKLDSLLTLNFQTFKKFQVLGIYSIEADQENLDYEVDIDQRYYL